MTFFLVGDALSLSTFLRAQCRARELYCKILFLSEKRKRTQTQTRVGTRMTGSPPASASLVGARAAREHEFGGPPFEPAAKDESSPYVRCTPSAKVQGGPVADAHSCVALARPCPGPSPQTSERRIDSHPAPSPRPPQSSSTAPRTFGSWSRRASPLSRRCSGAACRARCCISPARITTA